MSWYIDQRGRKVFIERDDLAYTVPEPPDELPLRALNYLAVAAKTVNLYQEHSIDEPDAKGSKKKGAVEGRSRGYVVRVEQEERTRVLAPFQAAAGRLLDSGIVSRLDIDETARGNTKKKRSKASKDPDAAAQQTPAPEDDNTIKPVIDVSSLGYNECCIETVARCQHNAHGCGFSVEIGEGGTLQRVHFFHEQN